MPIKNGIVNGAASVISSIVSIIGSILIVRGLSVDDYGLFSYYLWLAGFLAALGTINLPLSITKVTSELRGAGEDEEAERLTGRTVVFLVGLNLLITAVLVFLGFLPGQERRYALWLVAVILIPNALASVSRSFLWGQQRYTLVSIVNILSSILSLALVVAGYFFLRNLLWFTFSILSVNIAQFVLLGAIYWLPRLKSYSLRVVRLKIKPSTQKVFLGFAFPAVVDLIIDLVVWQRSEVFFLERLSDLKEVGFYSISFTIFSMLLMLGWALINGFYPAISKDFGAKDWQKIQEKVKQGVILGTLYAVPLLFGGILTIRPLIELLYGQKMLPAAPVAQILLVGIFPGMMIGITGLTLSGIGGIWDRVKAGVLMIFVNIGLDLLLIPGYGALGAAIANLTSQTANAILLIIILHNKYQLMYPWRGIAEISLVGFLSAAIPPYFLLRQFPSIMGVIIVIPVSAVAYLAAIKSLGFGRSLRVGRFQL